MNQNYWIWSFVWLLSGCLGANESGNASMASGGQTAISAMTTPGTGGSRNSGDNTSVTASGGMAIMGGAVAMQENPERESQSRPEDKITIETLVDDRIVPINDGVGLLAFEVPENTLSVTILVFGQPDTWYGIDRWMGPTGIDLITPDWVSIEGNEAGCQSCLNYTAQGQGVSTTIAPNRPMVDIKAGEHRIAIVGWLEGFAADDAVIRIIAKRGKTWPEAGTIDMNFYFTGAQEWTAETAPSDTYFRACINRVNELYGQMGIRIGEMTFQDVDPGLSTVSTEEDDDRLARLLALSNHDKGTGVHVFFVDEIVTGEADFPSIPGVAAAVPSPPGLPGTALSGVAVATRGPLSVEPANRFLDPPAIGQTIAHELGHLLGLEHTSEYDGVTHDAYSDTADNDTSYLMHADGTGAVISPQQQRTIMANPSIYHTIK